MNLLVDLCREYVKGRDWYDFVWYVGNRVPLNHDLLTAALNQQGKWAGQQVRTSDAWVCGELEKVIRALDWTKAREDVSAFVHSDEMKSVDSFSADFFLSLVDRMFDGGRV